MKKESTKIGDVFLNYIDIDQEGRAYFGERRIELPIGHDFLNRFDPETVIEVGSTMFNQGRRYHKVVDLHDTSHPSIINEDGAKFDYAGYNVLSISTIEHFDDTVVNGVWRTGVVMTDKSFDTVKRIVETANHFLLTFPVGIHSKLDEKIIGTNIPRRIIYRDQDNNWDGRTHTKNIQYTYDSPFQCANAIYVITDLDNYFKESENYQKSTYQAR